MNFFIRILVGVALQFIGYLLQPKPQGAKPAATSDLEEPTAEAGRPRNVVFGSITVTGPNILATMNKKSLHRKASGGKK